MNKNKVTKLNTLEQNFQSNLNKLLSNEQEISVDIHNKVLSIIKQIQEFGDKALLDLVDKYDGIKVDKIEQLKISQKLSARNQDAFYQKNLTENRRLTRD